MSEQTSGPQGPASQGAGPQLGTADPAGGRPAVVAVCDSTTPGTTSGTTSGLSSALTSGPAEVSAAGALPDDAPSARAGHPALVKLYWHLAITGILTFAGFALALLVARLGGYSDLMLLVLLAGSTGAVINNYYRLAKLACADAASMAEMDNSVFTVQLYVSVLISGVLGIIMYGLCLSGLIAGDLFPAFKGVQADYASVTELMANVSPAGNIDAAKAVVWAFIAGFSEKLIPNLIDRMADRAEARSG